jgi:hypothetical protein
MSPQEFKDLLKVLKEIRDEMISLNTKLDFVEYISDSLELIDAGITNLAETIDEENKSSK